MIYAIIFGFLGSVTGLTLSYIYDIPSGASIIFTLIVLYGIIKIISIFFSKAKINVK